MQQIRPTDSQSVAPDLVKRGATLPQAEAVEEGDVTTYMATFSCFEERDIFLKDSDTKMSPQTLIFRLSSPQTY